MVAPPAGAADRRRVPAAVAVFSLARRHSAASAGAIVDDFWSGGCAWSGWLVDGIFGSEARRQRLAISPWVSSDARHRDLCGDLVDGSAACGAAALRRYGASAVRGARARGSFVVSDLSWRTCRWP